jgi:MFS family permease
LRLFIGIAVGADYRIATALLAEFAPQKYRGPFVGFLLVMWFVGAAAGYVVGDLLLRTEYTDAWRWMLTSAALPTALFLFLRRNTPESPRWLVQMGRLMKAKAGPCTSFTPTSFSPRKSGTAPLAWPRPSAVSAQLSARIACRLPWFISVSGRPYSWPPEVTLFGFLASWQMAPETRHSSLEDAASLDPMRA